MARSSITRCLAVGILAIAAAACSSPAPTECNDGLDNDFDGFVDAVDPDCANGTEFSPIRDHDRDGISDEEEGFVGAVDTDGDGNPDFSDEDSDNDGLPDQVEAGDFDIETLAVDSDGDGIPDFRDTDSDNNGLPDSNIGSEGLGDVDFDGIPNYADIDDDGDGIEDIDEIGPGPIPLDTDGDGQSNFQDRDSDGDLIMDLHESLSDPDGDMIPAYLDRDSDNDCIEDRLEAGDFDLMTPPRDSNGDNIGDFLSIDSDGDFLLDELEDLNCNGMVDPGESSPEVTDSDGDGVSDVVEYASDTDPTDPADNPQANGDFVFELPYMGPTHPSEDSLEFTTSVKFVDLYFSFDTTGSMIQELNAMASPTAGVPAIIDTLRCLPTGGTCVITSDCPSGICFNGECIEDPAAGDGCLPNMWTGVGRFDEIDSFTNVLSPQPDAALTAQNIPGTGGGASEAPYQAPACVADGANCTNAANCAAGADTCAGFRDDAIRILFQITDANDQCSGTRCGLFDGLIAGAELLAKEIKFVGLFGDDDQSGAGTAQSVATEIALASNSVGFWGDPFVYPAEDAAVVDQTVQAVREIFNNIELDVTITAEDLPDDDGDALQFIDFLEVNTSGVGNCTALPSIDSDGDGRDDAFPNLRAGIPVCWNVHPVEMNVTENPTIAPRIFRAQLTVRGDSTTLDSRTVLFFVPPSLIILD